MKPFLTLALLLPASFAFAGEPTRSRMTWQVGEDERVAWVSIPDSAKSEHTPLVFVFHGHGGRMAGAARMFRTHELWPEAIVVYPQGLNTPGMLTDPEGKKSGWQSRAGNQGDRDLKLFDTMLSDLSAKFKVDPKRVYSTGHSNGGGFTYLLWAERGDKLAAVAPSASAGARKLRDSQPLPAMLISGEKDALVKFEWQRAAIEAVKRFNRCSNEGEAWAKNATLFPAGSDAGAPLVALVYPGGHKFYADAAPLIVRFFKAQSRK